MLACDLPASSVIGMNPAVAVYSSRWPFTVMACCVMTGLSGPCDRAGAAASASFGVSANAGHANSHNNIAPQDKNSFIAREIGVGTRCLTECACDCSAERRRFRCEVAIEKALAEFREQEVRTDDPGQHNEETARQRHEAELRAERQVRQHRGCDDDCTRAQRKQRMRPARERIAA